VIFFYCPTGKNRATPNFSVYSNAGMGSGFQDGKLNKQGNGVRLPRNAGMGSGFQDGKLNKQGNGVRLPRGKNEKKRDQVLKYDLF